MTASFLPVVPSPYVPHLSAVPLLPVSADPWYPVSSKDKTPNKEDFLKDPKKRERESKGEHSSTKKPENKVVKLGGRNKGGRK